MSLPLLANNVTDLVVTPFLGLELMPRHYPDWDKKTNNNWIRLENEAQMLVEELTVVRRMAENAVINVRNEITAIRSEVQNEAILRSAADAFLQGQINAIPTNLSLTFRLTNQVLVAEVPTTIDHNLGSIPRVTIIRQVGAASGIDVSYYYDTVITHNNANQAMVVVGVTGLYTIICNT